MVVGFTTICAISAYHHWCCECKSRSGRGVQHYICQWLAAGQWFSRVIQFLAPKKLNVVESGVKHNETIPIFTFIHLQILQVSTHLEAIRTYIRSRIEKERESFDPENIRNFLDLYIAEEGKKDSKISGILWKKRKLDSDGQQFR